MEQDFDQLVKIYGKIIYRCAWSYCKSNADAEDITQEVFLYYLQKRPVFCDVRHAQAWFLRVAINFSKNHLNSWWNRNTEGITDEDSENYAANQEQKDVILNYTQTNIKQSSVEQEALAEGMEIWDKVCLLPEKYRNVIFLYYMENYSVKEIGEILGQKSATIRTWMARARQKLKKMLE